MKISLLVTSFLFILSHINGQKINHTSAFRDIDNNTYFRFNYENDYFSSSDENYTQGYNIEFAAPAFARNPINRLLLKSKSGTHKFGLSIEHIGYTPNSIGRPEIQYGDRPFASAIMLKSFSISTDSIKSFRVSSGLSIGAIGPLAFGKEMQTAIHRAINGTIPQGWKNQITNDLVINYQLIYEKRILTTLRFIELQTYSSANLGTLFTNVSVGITTILGRFNSALSNRLYSNKFEIYLYSQPVANLIGYDATLQGGLFNKSPYTIDRASVERITFQYNFGLVIKSKKLYLEYSRTYLSPEFKNGPTAGWGGIRIGGKF